MKDMSFEVEENGKIKKYEIVTYVKNPSNNKTYVVYKEPGSNEVFASLYTIEKGELILDEIKTDEEWDFIEEVLDKLEEKDV